MKEEQNITVNLTIEIPSHILVELENYLSREFRLIDSCIVPDTRGLYESNANFRKLVKAIKDAKLARDRFINENN